MTRAGFAKWLVAGCSLLPLAAQDHQFGMQVAAVFPTANLARTTWFGTSPKPGLGFHYTTGGNEGLGLKIRLDGVRFAANRGTETTSLDSLALGLDMVVVLGESSAYGFAFALGIGATWDRFHWRDTAMTAPYDLRQERRKFFVATGMNFDFSNGVGIEARYRVLRHLALPVPGTPDPGTLDLTANMLSLGLTYRF